MPGAHILQGSVTLGGVREPVKGFPLIWQQSAKRVRFNQADPDAEASIDAVVRLDEVVRVAEVHIDVRVSSKGRGRPEMIMRLGVAPQIPLSHAVCDRPWQIYDPYVAGQAHFGENASVAALADSTPGVS